MKTNYYLCITEYHVLLSILLSVEEYGDPARYVNRIVLCNEGRFNNRTKYDLSSYNNIEYAVYEKDFVKSSSFIKLILNECTGILFLFNLNNPHFIYLAYKLRRIKQAQTSFVQEGLASYNYLSYSFKQRLGLLRYHITCLLKYKIYDLPFHLYAFGIRGMFGRIFDYYDKVIDSRVVSSFWLSHPDYAKYGRNKLHKLPDFGEQSKNAANVFFKYRNTLQLKVNDIVFIDQRIEGSFDFIAQLGAQLQNTDIYIKLHPRTPQSWADDYKKNKNVHILTQLTGIPIELFLQNLHKAIVITPFSSALLINNESCHYYYAYKWFVNNGYDIENNELVIPGQHVKILENVRDITLY